MKERVLWTHVVVKSWPNSEHQKKV